MIKETSNERDTASSKKESDAEIIINQYISDLVSCDKSLSEDHNLKWLCLLVDSKDVFVQPLLKNRFVTEISLRTLIELTSIFCITVDVKQKANKNILKGFVKSLQKQIDVDDYVENHHLYTILREITKYCTDSGKFQGFVVKKLAKNLR